MPVKPPKAFTFRFCNGCGRNNLHFMLKARHFVFGRLCKGEIVEVKYRLAQSGAQAGEGEG